MNILMMTNTYAPHVGGVARSVETFSGEFWRLGHRVLVVAPEYDPDVPPVPGIFRVPAIGRFNRSGFPLAMPVSRSLSAAIDAFAPDIVHAHHPFLIGSTALRVAHQFDLPLVFTQHTLHEQTARYVLGSSSRMLQRFVVHLSTSYANLCDEIFAPSGSVAELLRARGVEPPISVVPTGIDPARFRRGSGAGFRAAMDIPPDAFVIGHIGRLTPEKNLEVLTRGVVAFLRRHRRARFLVAGTGCARPVIREILVQHGLADRLHGIDTLGQPLLASAYQAMDVFAFAARNETQGMVLAEAMAAGVPVVAIDGPGVRELVADGVNGRLLPGESAEDFADALDWVLALPAARLDALRQGMAQSLDALSLTATAELALGAYRRLLRPGAVRAARRPGWWQGARRRLETEWDMLRNVAHAAGAALTLEEAPTS